MLACVASTILSTAAQCEPEEMNATANLIAGTGVLIGSIIDGSQSGGGNSSNSGETDDMWGSV